MNDDIKKYEKSKGVTKKDFDSSEEKQIKLLKSINDNTKSIKFWVSFWSWISIIGFACWLIILVTAIN